MPYLTKIIVCIFTFIFHNIYKGGMIVDNLILKNYDIEKLKPIIIDAFAELIISDYKEKLEKGE